MPSQAPTLWASVITILAMLIYMYTASRAGSARGKHKIEAPAVTGHPEFERAYRVQMNTLEAMPVFLPSLWLATALFSSQSRMLWWLPAAFGAVWLIGRIVYMQAYMADPGKRSTGFGIAALALIALFILAIAGTVMTWMANTGGTA